MQVSFDKDYSTVTLPSFPWEILRYRRTCGNAELMTCCCWRKLKQNWSLVGYVPLIFQDFKMTSQSLKWSMNDLHLFLLLFSLLCKHKGWLVNVALRIVFKVGLGKERGRTVHAAAVFGRDRSLPLSFACYRKLPVRAAAEPARGLWYYGFGAVTAEKAQAAVVMRWSKLVSSTQLPALMF